MGNGGGRGCPGLRAARRVRRSAANPRPFRHFATLGLEFRRDSPLSLSVLITIMVVTA